MRLRHLALPALAVCLAASPATAATRVKPACNLLVDEAGDGEWDLAPVVTSPVLDVLGGDLATGPKQMVAVLRLASTDFAADRYSNLGYSWSMGFTSSLGTNYAFEASRSMAATMSYRVVIDGERVPEALLKAEMVGKTFVWTIDRKASPALTRPKNVFTAFRGGSQVQSSTADTALTKTTKYADRAPSCVKAL